jgi:GntR family transcriptional regulator
MAKQVKLRYAQPAMTAATPTWNEDTPIYRQLADRVIARILDGSYQEGEMIPSVRQLASEHGVNPLTASKAVQELADFTERRRGIGLVIKEGVREILLKRQRRQFIREEWPLILAKMEQLEIDLRELPGARKSR